MTSLTGRAPKDTYKDLLQVSNSNAGIDATSRAIEDGEGTASLIKVSTTATQVGAATLVDSNENEVVKTAGVASAVNEVTITNAATGGSPIVEATGGDSVIGLDFKTKGGGAFRVNSIPVIVSGGAVVGEASTTPRSIMIWGDSIGTSALDSPWTIDSAGDMTAGGALGMGSRAISGVSTLTATTIATDSITVGGAGVVSTDTLDNEILYATARAVAMS